MTSNNPPETHSDHRELVRQWPGLVGMLNLNASMAKAGVRYSTLWSQDFKDDYFLENLHRCLAGEVIVHDSSYVPRSIFFPKPQI